MQGTERSLRTPPRRLRAPVATPVTLGGAAAISLSPGALPWALPWASPARQPRRCPRTPGEPRSVGSTRRPPPLFTPASPAAGAICPLSTDGGTDGFIDIRLGCVLPVATPSPGHGIVPLRPASPVVKETRPTRRAFEEKNVGVRAETRAIAVEEDTRAPLLRADVGRGMPTRPAVHEDEGRNGVYSRKSFRALHEALREL